MVKRKTSVNERRGKKKLVHLLIHSPVFSVVLVLNSINCNVAFMRCICMYSVWLLIGGVLTLRSYNCQGYGKFMLWAYSFYCYCCAFATTILRWKWCCVHGKQDRHVMPMSKHVENSMEFVLRRMKREFKQLNERIRQIFEILCAREILYWIIEMEYAIPNSFHQFKFQFFENVWKFDSVKLHTVR